MGAHEGEGQSKNRRSPPPQDRKFHGGPYFLLMRGSFTMCGAFILLMGDFFIMWESFFLFVVGGRFGGLPPPPPPTKIPVRAHASMLADRAITLLLVE